MSKPDNLEKCKKFYKEAKADNKNFFDRAKRNYRYRIGEQWDKADLDILDAQGRAALTINKILPVTNTLSGLQRDYRQDFTVRPRKGGTANVAKVLSALVKHTVDQSNGEWQISECFDDGTTGGKGWLGLDIDYSTDPLNGDVVLQKISPFDMLEDCNAKEYDLNQSAKYVIKMWGWSKDDIILNYPKKKNAIEHGVLGDKYDTFLGSGTEFDDYNDDKPPDTDDMDSSSELDEYRIIECWWKKKERRLIMVNVNTMETKIVDPAKKKVAQALVAYTQRGTEMGGNLVGTIMSKMGMQYTPGEQFQLIERVVPILHVTTFVGDIELDDKEDPFNGISDYPFVRFCPYWVDGYEMGIVDNLIGPQDEHNKRRSQALHHLNQSANSGWVGDRDAVDDWDSVEKFGSKPGMVIKKKPGAQLERIKPSLISTGHLQLDQLSAQDIKDISGVSTELQGQSPDKAVSGRAIALQQQQGIQISKPVFDNLNYSLQILGSLMVDIIRLTGVYSEEEIKLVIDEEEVQIDMQQLGDMKLGNYGVKVALSAYAPTLRIANYLSLMEGVEKGLPIDPIFVIKASDLPNKDDIVEDIQKKQQAQAQMQQQQMRMEQQKIEADYAIDLAKIEATKQKTNKKEDKK